MSEPETTGAKSEASAAIERLLAVMAALRHPTSGCPWDLRQDFRSIAPYTIEEAYEVADAIAREDAAALKDELGDLLFNVVYHARLAEEAGAFAFADIAGAASDKMVRRHPHVFAAPSDPAAAAARADQHGSWERLKAEERAAAGKSDGLFADIPAGLPALPRAAKIVKRAMKLANIRSAPERLIDKVAEEVAELAAEIKPRGDAAQDRMREEYGDLLLAMAHLGLALDIDPDSALRAATLKFARRFEACAAALHERGENFECLGYEALDSLWRDVKARESSRADGF